MTCAVVKHCTNGLALYCDQMSDKIQLKGVLPSSLSLRRNTVCCGRKTSQRLVTVPPQSESREQKRSQVRLPSLRSDPRGPTSSSEAPPPKGPTTRVNRGCFTFKPLLVLQPSECCVHRMQVQIALLTLWTNGEFLQRSTKGDID